MLIQERVVGSIERGKNEGGLCRKRRAGSFQKRSYVFRHRPERFGLTESERRLSDRQMLFPHFAKPCGSHMAIVDKIALALVILGSLNWGSIGIFGVDLVSWIFGDASALSRILFTLVGLAGLWSISLLFREDPAEDTSTLPH